VIAVAAAVATAAPALASWTAKGTGAGAAAAGGIGPSITSLTRNCSGNNHSITVNFSLPTGVPSATAISVKKGTSQGGETTTLLSTTAGSGTTAVTDSSASNNATNWYLVSTSAGTRWVGSAESSSDRC
jgi:hypothetical protein